MTTIRFAPGTELQPLSRDPFFRGLWDLFDAGVPVSNGQWHPAMDVVDAEDKLVVSVDLPGIDPKDVQVNLQNDVLTVKGERKREAKEKSTVLKREQIHGAFTRSFELPYRVQVDKVTAQVRNGVMTIELPKAEEHLGRQIPVEIER